MRHGRLIKRCILILVIGLSLFLATILIQGSEQTINYARRDYVANKRTASKNPNSVPTILWWDSVYSSVDDVRTCGQFRCRVTDNRGIQHYPGTKVFLFYGSMFKPFNLPFPRKSEDLWALIQEESPRNAYWLCHNGTIDIFNITSSWKRKSNYPIPTQWLKCSDWLWDTEYIVSLEEKNKLRQQGMAPVLYLHSDCGVPSDRDHFVTMLQKYIRVDSYGTCLRNKKMPDSLRFRNSMSPMEDTSFFRWAARYKFTLAMENYASDDYITEKLWRPLRLGSVPIVFGASNVKDFLPDNNSAIVINDFQDIKQLADYIHEVDKDDSRYLSYHKFKRKGKPLENKFLQHLLDRRDWQPANCKRSGERKYSYQSIFDGFECYICKLLHSIQNDKRLGLMPTVYRADASHYHCPAPRRFNELGQYKVEDSLWAENWHYGKYEAAVMRDLVNNEKTINEKEYNRLVKEVWMTDKHKTY